MNNKSLYAAVAVSALAVAMSAGVSAQIYNGSTGAAPVQTVVNGTSSTATTGDSTVAPFQNTVTTVQNQAVNSTTAATTTAVGPTTVNGIVYNGTKTVSGTGTQNRTSTTTLFQTFNPGPPPVVISSVPGGPTYANVGSATVSAVSASGSAGNVVESYGSVLSSSGPVTNGSVVTTTNAYTATTAGSADTGGSAGITFAQQTGTATYDPSTGLVTVNQGTTTAKTTISAFGVNTTGAIQATTLSASTVNATNVVASGDVSARTFTAAGNTAGASVFNANGGRITGLANGTGANDAVNLSQLTSATAALNSSLTAQIDYNNTRAQAGTAVAVALGGGFFLPSKKFNVNVSYGNYEGQSAIAGSIGYLITDSVALNGGVAGAFNNGGVGFRVGGTYGF